PTLSPTLQPPPLPYTTLFRSSCASAQQFFFHSGARGFRRVNHSHQDFPVGHFRVVEPAAPVGKARGEQYRDERGEDGAEHGHFVDRKSTRLNSSHQIISYAVF